MSKLITAEEARGLKPSEGKNWDKLIEKIKFEAFIGNNEVYSNGYLMKDRVQELENAGYKVSISEVNKCHKITW